MKVAVGHRSFLGPLEPSRHWGELAPGFVGAHKGPLRTMGVSLVLGQVLGSAAKSGAHFTLRLPWAGCISSCWAAGFGGGLRGLMRNCLSYPSQCIFSYFCTLPRSRNPSPGILSSCEDLFMHRQLFQLMFPGGFRC